MPMKTKKFTKRGGKKSYPVRRGGARKRNIAVTRIAQRTIPDKLMVKLPYTDLQSLTGLGSVQKSYNINGMYDPETGVINDQNLGFAEYMRLFNKYRVFKIDYQVVLHNVSLDSVVAGSISFSESGQQMLISDVQQLQLPYSRRFTLATKGTASSSLMIKGSIFLPRVVGKTSEQYRTNDNYYGSVSSNPPQVIQMSINGININQAVQVALQCDVRYTCHCELYDRVDVLSTRAPAEEV